MSFFVLHSSLSPRKVSKTVRCCIMNYYSIKHRYNLYFAPDISYPKRRIYWDSETWLCCALLHLQ